MENSFLAIFDKIPCTIAHCLWPNFGVTLKIHKNSNFDRNQLKFLHNITTCIRIRKKYRNKESFFDEIWPMTMYYSPWSLAKFWSNFEIF